MGLVEYNKWAEMAGKIKLFNCLGESGWAMKTKKRILWGSLVLVSGFILADYLEFFSTIYVDGSIALPFTFEFIDSANGTPVEGVVVNAAYNGVDVLNQCHDEGGGSVYVVVCGGGYGYKKTFFFKKPSLWRTIKQMNEKEIDFTFQHPLYKTANDTLSKEKFGEIYTVKLISIEPQH